MKTSQTQKLINLLSDGLEHSTIEILEKVYGNDHLGLARVSARIYDAKQQGFEIVGRRDKISPSIYWYRIVKEAVQTNILDTLNFQSKSRQDNTMNFR
jgi:hypothetical protein